MAGGFIPVWFLGLLVPQPMLVVLEPLESCRFHGLVQPLGVFSASPNPHVKCVSSDSSRLSHVLARLGRPCGSAEIESISDASCAHCPRPRVACPSRRVSVHGPRNVFMIGHMVCACGPIARVFVRGVSVLVRACWDQLCALGPAARGVDEPSWGCIAWHISDIST